MCPLSPLPAGYKQTDSLVDSPVTVPTIILRAYVQSRSLLFLLRYYRTVTKIFPEFFVIAMTIIRKKAERQKKYMCTCILLLFNGASILFINDFSYCSQQFVKLIWLCQEDFSASLKHIFCVAIGGKSTRNDHF